MAPEETRRLRRMQTSRHDFSQSEDEVDPGPDRRVAPEPICRLVEAVVDTQRGVDLDNPRCHLRVKLTPWNSNEGVAGTVRWIWIES